MKKLLILGIPILLIIAINLMYGGVISWMLSFVIIACLVFFVAKLGLESLITQKLKNYNPGDERIGLLIQFDNKWKSILNFLLLTTVFLSLATGIYFTMAPKGKFPWFTNTEYHGLSNSGIAFSNQLKIYPLLEDSSNSSSNISFAHKRDQDAVISFNHFYQPVTLYNEKAEEAQLLNKIFDADATNGFELENGSNKIQVTIIHENNNIFQRLFGAPKDETEYQISISSSDNSILDELNLKGPFTDKVSIKNSSLKTGMSLFNLFLDNQDFKSTKNETYQVLEKILMDLGDTYLLVNRSGSQKSLSVFPAKELLDNGYRLFINKKLVAPQTNFSTNIALNDKFYIGFNNNKKLLHISNLNEEQYDKINKKSFVLVFDYPNTYMLRSPGIQAKGDKNIRFITNNFDEVINTNTQEGFYFTTYNLRLAEPINGAIDYVTGGPNTPFVVGVTDNNANNKHFEADQKRFSLQSSDKNIHYLFEVRDFSKNGFSLPKTILWLGISYLAFIVLSVFFGGKRIDRIEPIILSAILALTALRYIMFWRVATFPPLENITKYELENTLRNFDFNLGFDLPIPLTLIWILLFCTLIILYRKFGKHLQDQVTINKILRIKPDNIKSINLSYALIMVGMLVLFMANKRLLHIEILTRIVSIFIPLIIYWYYSKLCNKNYTYAPLNIQNSKSKLLIQAKAYFYYLFNNPTFVITVITLGFFALCDRGFAILFALFILLKNIFINFLKKPLDRNNNSVKRMLYKPNNYWIYGFSALVVYLIVLSVKSLFYYLLLYKFWVITASIIFGLLLIYILFPKNDKLKKYSLIFTGLWLLLIAITPTRNFIDQKIASTIKHVQYRASIIHQPIGELMQQNEYTSFKTRKIIETAENQWFINSYISKPYDNRFTINLRPHSRIGVDYPTQTRDVVVARFLISEMGNLVMYLILGLILLPMILYLMSYKVHLITLSNNEKRDIESYSGLIPLIILFTLSLFVWLTATNRFVFFGQDFPFLSLTSRISVVLPLMLLGFTLTQKPTVYNAIHINLKNHSIKYLFFFGLIASFALTTIRQNELNNKNFTVIMETTKEHLDIDLNNILSNIQDSLEAKHIKPSYTQLISILEKDKVFKNFRNDTVKDVYTKSILKNLIDQPSTAFRLDNPLFIIYDNGRYYSRYNKNLYLELPPIESRNIWNGNINETLFYKDIASATITFNNQTKNEVLPYFRNDIGKSIQLAILPGSWFGNNQEENIGLINITNNFKGRAKVFVYKNKFKNFEQNAASFTTTLEHDDIATIYLNDQSTVFGFRNSGNLFALNKWINGTYKIIYPQKENNFWIYNFANAIRTTYSNETDLHNNVGITLDYELSKKVQQLVNISESTANKKTNNYNFSVMGADGDGNVRFMTDYVTSRKPLDPNNDAAIFALQRKQFFFSNAKNERDQWGNRNLLNLFLGPGSSIKPLTAAAVSSQLNAGWEQLILSPPTDKEIKEYAGFKLLKPWKNDEHYHDFVTMPKYIEVSSNFYQSLVIFLGSYSRDYFYYQQKNTYSLSTLLTQTAGENNKVPDVWISNQKYYLPNYNKGKGNWPATDRREKHLSYFGNENSLISLGFEQNFNLRTKDKDKKDFIPTSLDKVNYVDTNLFKSLEKNRSGGMLWSFPEQSFFLQSERAFDEKYQNFNLGLKTTSLGGYPYRLTPFKMLEMYMSLFTQNKNFHLGVTPKADSFQRWTIDTTWGDPGIFNLFLARNIFTGMQNVIFGANGTARRLQSLKTQYPGYYFYAKTGTINEQTSKGKSSRRLIIMVSNKDLTFANYDKDLKIYGWFFAVDNTGDFDWDLLQNIIKESMNASSFKYYFNRKS
ncbi:MAG TPA: hypothetical protein PKX92_07645 [Edaphocola sp.]|nr:hypothetical protein [Edaphocola sp.]